MMYGQGYPQGHPGVGGYAQPMPPYHDMAYPQHHSQQAYVQHPQQQPPNGVARAAVGSTAPASKSGLLSVVIKPDEMGEWYNCVYLIPHEPIRQWCLDMETYVVNNDSFDAVAYPWKMDNFFRFYNEYFYDVVHHHHDTEENLVNPWFSSKGINTPNKLEADHVVLMKYLDGVKDFERQYRTMTSPTAPVVAGKATAERVRELTLSLKRHLADMCKAMGPHLAEEEQYYPSQMRDKVSQAEWDAFEPRIIKKLGLKGAEQGLPHIVACMQRWNPAMVGPFIEKLPGPIRYLFNTRWQPKYHNYCRPLLEGLTGDRPP
eukprot:CAMPEP_0174923928 /NCGR_PEP_ID=MMETSP1355-20121228/6913_1 /TAXON_ID=464990 /ORGANISM="Hemiselmis tepida, Strain CCMP443" /LENGTH=316 /DNA_ID=CAMNT_0016169669 /DNA_START=23 /DNA_END=969 /DNA_ORIENTATION=-